MGVWEGPDGWMLDFQPGLRKVGAGTGLCFLDEEDLPTIDEP